MERDALLVDRGRYVLKITPSISEAAPLSVAACESLAAQPVVRSSGSVLSSELLEIASAPGTRIRRTEVTSGLLVTLGLVDGDQQVAVLMGGEAARELDTAAGALVPLRRPREQPEHFFVSQVGGDRPRFPEGNRALMVVSLPSGVTGECFVSLDPMVFTELRQGGVLALAAFGEQTAQVASLARVEAGLTPSVQYQQRASRFGPLVVAGMAAILASAFLLARRSEMSVYLATGTPRTALFLLLYLEYLLLAVLAGVFASMFAAGYIFHLGHWQVAVIHGMNALAGSFALAMLVFSMVLILSIPRQDVLAALKDR